MINWRAVEYHLAQARKEMEKAAGEIDGRPLTTPLPEDLRNGITAVWMLLSLLRGQALRLGEEKK